MKSLYKAKINKNHNNYDKYLCIDNATNLIVAKFQFLADLISFVSYTVKVQ